MCAPESGAGSNEPQKYFGRSDHVEALSQLRPLRSRKGMSQLGIPKMRQKSEFSRPIPLRTPTFPKLGNMDRHPFDGSTGGTLRAHPGLAQGQAHLWICVRTDSGATRRPGVPFPKGTSGNHRILGFFKRRCGQKLKARSVRQIDGVPCVTAAALALYQRIKIRRYVQLAKLDIPFHW